MRSVLAASFFLLVTVLLGQDTLVFRSYTTTHATEEIQIDGVLDEAMWDVLPWGDDFTVRQPNNGDKPKNQTKFKITYDDNYLYLGVYCLIEDISKLESRLARRDNFPGDWIEINIDSYNDNITAYSFTLSLSGVKGDEFVSNNGQNWDSNWNPIWYGATQEQEDGWTAEMKIPFSQLRFGDQDVYEWGFNINRRDFAEDEMSSWQFWPVNVTGFVSNFGTLYGIENIKPKKQLEIQPYVTTSISTEPSEAGNPFRSGSNSRLGVGLDGKVGVTNDLTLDFTINPDFGQVEADPSAINIDGFQIFFNEQRPFFIENANLFSRGISQFEAGGSFWNDNLFYSRRIGASPRGSVEVPDGSFVERPTFTSIIGAAKFSGKTKKGLSIGVLESITAEERVKISTDGVETSAIAEPLTNYFVGTLTQDFKGAESQIGLTLTAVNRDLEGTGLEDQFHKTAYTGGVNFLHTWKDREWNLKGNVIFSNLTGTTERITATQESFEHFFQRPDADHLSVDTTATSLGGHGGALSLANYGGEDNLSFEHGITWRSPGLELNDIGFMNTADQINYVAWMGYQVPKPFGIFRRYRVNYNHYFRWTYGGEHLYSAFNFNTHAGFTNYWGAGGGLTWEAKDISTQALFGGPRLRQNQGLSPWFYVESDSRKKVVYGFNVRGFRSIGLDAGALSFNSVGLFLSYQPTDAMSLSFRPRYSHQDRAVQNVSYEQMEGKDRYVTGRIDQRTLSMSMRLNYSLGPNMTVEYWGQPFISRGNYTEYKYITDPLAAGYQDRFHLYDDSEITSTEDGSVWMIDENSDGVVDYEFSDPDFNFLQFRSNLVFRWEYKPNSEFFLVWTQGTTNSGDPDKGLFNSLSEDLFGQDARNTFLMKLTYRFY